MPSTTEDLVQVLLSVPNGRVGARIAKALLAARLCACVQTLGPVTSRYRWKGRIEQARESLLLVKTRTNRVPAVEAEILRLHPYEVPEILVIPVAGGHGAYLDWVRRECSATEDSAQSV